MGCVGRGYDPFVVWLVENSINARVMEAPVDPVDAEICEDDE